jgi:hypothetical protein
MAAPDVTVRDSLPPQPSAAGTRVPKERKIIIEVILEKSPRSANHSKKTVTTSGSQDSLERRGNNREMDAKAGGLVAGGGFVPQSLIDSVQLTDSTMVRNAKKGDKGELFIQFSFSVWFRRFKPAPAPTAHRRSAY